MATRIDPRMISNLKPLFANDARFLNLSAFQSQITFLSGINFVLSNLNTTTLDVNTTLNTDQINSNNITNTDNLNSNTGSINILNTSSIANSNLITTNNFIATNNTSLVNLTATGNITTNFFVITANNNYTFSDADNSKVIHFDTTTTPEISAIFPNTLSNGFNVGLINAGIGVIYLSGQDVINAPGNINSEIYTGMFIYKVNDDLFGVGNLE